MESARNLFGVTTESKALAGARPVPSRPVLGYGSLSGAKVLLGTSEDGRKSTGADAPGSPTGTRHGTTTTGPRCVLRGREEPTHALLCVLGRAVLTQQPSLAWDVGDFEEQLKVAAARGRLAYNSESVRKAVEATLAVRRKRARA